MVDRFNPAGRFSIDRRKKLPRELPGADVAAAAAAEEVTVLADTVLDLSTPGLMGIGAGEMAVSEPLLRRV